MLVHVRDARSSAWYVAVHKNGDLQLQKTVYVDYLDALSAAESHATVTGCQCIVLAVAMFVEDWQNVPTRVG